MHTRLFSIAAPATRTRGGSGAEAALVSLSDGCEDSLPCSEFQPRCSAGSHAYGSSIGQRIRGRPWGPSGTAPAVDEDAGRIFGDGVAANQRCWCCRPARGPDRRPRCRPRTGPPAVPWGISGSPGIHLMMCYSNSLKYKKESVRPQFLSLRQSTPDQRSEPRRMRSFPALSEPCGPAGGPILHRSPPLSAYFLRRNRTTAILVRTWKAS
jgi:hypothetical protein